MNARLPPTTSRSPRDVAAARAVSRSGRSERATPARRWNRPIDHEQHDDGHELHERERGRDAEVEELARSGGRSRSRGWRGAGRRG